MKSAAKGTVRTAKCRTLTENCKSRDSAQQHEPGRCMSGLHEMSAVRCRALGQDNSCRCPQCVRARWRDGLLAQTNGATLVHKASHHAAY